MPAFTATLAGAAPLSAPHPVHGAAAHGARTLFTAAATACGLSAHRKALRFTMGTEDVSKFDGSVLDLAAKHGSALVVGLRAWKVAAVRAGGKRRTLAVEPTTTGAELLALAAAVLHAPVGDVSLVSGGVVLPVEPAARLIDQPFARGADVPLKSLEARVLPPPKSVKVAITEAAAPMVAPAAVGAVDDGAAVRVTSVASLVTLALGATATLGDLRAALARLPHFVGGAGGGGRVLLEVMGATPGATPLRQLVSDGATVTATVTPAVQGAAGVVPA